MPSRVLVGALLMISTLGVGTMATNDHAVAPSKQWAIVNLQQVTRIGEAFVMGPILVVHDDARMAKGQPCTSIYRFDPEKGPVEEIVAFQCKPRRGQAVETFTLTTKTDKTLNLPGGTLTAYQFAADTEIHGVPVVP